MLDLLRAFLGELPELSEEEKHELVLGDKPERMTALAFKSRTANDTEFTFLHLRPEWGDHPVVIVSRDLTANGSTLTTPEDEVLNVRAELVGKRRTTVAPAHLVRIEANTYQVEMCPVSEAALDVTERIFDGEVPSLAEVLAEFGIELVDSEDDMLASEEGVQA